MKSQIFFSLLMATLLKTQPIEAANPFKANPKLLRQAEEPFRYVVHEEGGVSVRLDRQQRKNAWSIG